MGAALLDYNTPLTAEEQQFAEEHHNLIYKFLRHFHYSASEYYDIAAMGYLKAVKKYFGVERTQQYSFSTIAFCAMQGYISNFHRGEYRRIKHNVYYYGNGNDEESYGIIDTIADCTDCFETIFDNEEIKNIFSVLSEAEQKIFILTSKGYTQNEIALMMEYRSKKTVENKIYRARQRIKSVLVNGEIKNREESNKMSKTGGIVPTIDYDEMEKLYKQGLHDKDIAKKMNSCVRSVQKWRSKNNLPLNSTDKDKDRPIHQY